MKFEGAKLVVFQQLALKKLYFCVSFTLQSFTIMYFLDKASRDPYFNIALEEFVLKQSDKDIFMLWENSPSLIVGKHQNPYREVEPSCLINEEMPVIRRISGGGTVFHGEGNLNYTFITNAKNSEDKINFGKFTRPILQFLNDAGVPATMTGKSNLTVNGLKFSGNAAHVFKNRSIHHGTLLFDADLNRIKNYLRGESVHIHSRAVSSIRAKVTNLKPLLVNMDEKHFYHNLKSAVIQHFGNDGIFELKANELKKIQELTETKYKTKAWNFGYSPDYLVENSLQATDFNAKFQLKVNKGIISSVKILGDNNSSLSKDIEQALIGKFHYPKDIHLALEPLLDSLNYTATEQHNLIIQFF